MRERDAARIAVRSSGPIEGRVRVPASKSLTNRALVLAALARGRTRLGGALLADDTSRMIAALEALGVKIAGTPSAGGAAGRIIGSGAGGCRAGGGSGAGGCRAGEGSGADGRPAGGDEIDLEIEGRDGAFAEPAAPLDVAGAGTAMRFLTCVAALVPGVVVIDGDSRMRERPMGPLLEALRALGVDAASIAGNGCPPVRVRGGELAGGSVRLPGDVSSQFVSGLSMVAPFADRGVVLEIAPPIVSRPYIDLTLSLMARFGAAPPREETLESGGLRYVFAARGESDREERGVYRATSYRVPPDASSAAYFFGAAAITGGRVTVEGASPRDPQADALILRLLPDLGCDVVVDPEGTTVAGPRSQRLAAFDRDVSAAPDLVPMLAVLALFADGPCIIRGVANLRLKESDRIHALATEIARLGAAAQERPDGLRIVPGSMRAARIETYRDHRIAMAFAIAGLATPGVSIADPGCVAKSFPGFWDTLAQLAPHAVSPQDPGEG